MSNLDPNIQEVLTAYNVKHITEFSDIEKLINVVEIDGVTSLKPAPQAENNTLIIFDNENYNSAYLHENLDVFIKSSSNIDDMNNIFNKGIDFAEEDFDEVESRGLLDAEYQNILNAIETTDVFYCNSPEISNKLFTEFYLNALNLPFNNNSALLFFNNDVDEVFIEPEVFNAISERSFAKIYDFINDKDKVLTAIGE